MGNGAETCTWLSSHWLEHLTEITLFSELIIPQVLLLAFRIKTCSVTKTVSRSSFKLHSTEYKFLSPHCTWFTIIHISKTQTTPKCSLLSRSLLLLSASLENFIITNHGEGLPPGDGKRALSKCDNHEITLPLNLPNCQHQVNTADYLNVDCKPRKSTERGRTGRCKSKQIFKNRSHYVKASVALR